MRAKATIVSTIAVQSSRISTSAARWGTPPEKEDAPERVQAQLQPVEDVCRSLRRRLRLVLRHQIVRRPHQQVERRPHRSEHRLRWGERRLVQRVEPRGGWGGRCTPDGSRHKRQHERPEQERETDFRIGVVVRSSAGLPALRLGGGTPVGRTPRSIRHCVARAQSYQPQARVIDEWRMRNGQHSRETQ